MNERKYSESIDDESLTRIPAQQRQDNSIAGLDSNHKKSQQHSKTAAFAEDLTIQGIIGEGGGGRVYLAYDESIGRRVAVKEMLDFDFQQKLNPTQQQEIINSFIHEAKITGKLEHPSIIPVYKLDKTHSNEPYYVMRYVKGETLEERLEACQQTSKEKAFNQRMKLLDTLIDVCDALAYAHSKGVIHRDLKPSNIIIGKFGETIILDWGLAQALDESSDTYFFRDVLSHQADTYSDLTCASGAGTLRYMAPEQLKGKAIKASDVYSLGVVLFKIITGELPYKGSNQSIQTQLLSDKPSPTPNYYMSINSPELANISPELGAICEKAMAKNPYDRFADASELSRQLKDYREGRMVNIYSYSKQELFRRFLSKNKFTVLMMMTVFVSIIAGAAFSLYYAMEMKQAREKAEVALISVTALGEKAQDQATKIAQAIDVNMQELFNDMKTTASRLDSLTEKQKRAEKNY